MSNLVMTLCVILLVAAFNHEYYESHKPVMFIIMVIATGFDVLNWWYKGTK